MTEQFRKNLRRMPYKEFLKTQFWRDVQIIVRERYQNICGMCGDDRREDLEVHHRTYEHHGYEDLHLEDLILLCRDCHQDVTERPHLQAWPFEDCRGYPEQDGYDNIVDDLRKAMKIDPRPAAG